MIIPGTLEVTSVSYSGPASPHNLVGCGLTGVDNLNQTFSPPQSSCTLSYFINTNFAEVSSPWTVTVNVQVKPIVEDTTAPVVTPPANQMVEATSAAGAVVTYPNATATDAVGVTSGPTCAPASGSTFALGTTTVTCTATDTAGNVGDGSFDVTVQDTTPPTLTLPGDLVVNATGPDGATVELDITATDLVDPSPTISCMPAFGSQFAIGTTTVSYTATDASGNQTSGSFMVTVIGAADQIDDLQEAVDNLDIASRYKFGLQFLLRLADWFQGGRLNFIACGALGEFSSRVASLSGRGIDPALANQLIEDATRVRAVIGCS